jgi:antitoxin (DNA-binding transcriptional repressor) of toxin-antitoxin stability system
MYNISVHEEPTTMKTATFTEFRRKAAAFFNDVERGETVRILRHGKPIADITPACGEESTMSWKQPALRLMVKGASLCREVLKERKRPKP